MPDGRVVTIPTHIRMSCPEILFKTDFYGKSCKSIQGICWKSIQLSDVDVRKDLCKNIILSGGNTMYEGLQNRL
jgi:actin-related protein